MASILTARSHDLVYIQIIQVKKWLSICGLIPAATPHSRLFNNILEFFPQNGSGTGFITVHTQQPQKEITQGIHTTTNGYRQSWITYMGIAMMRQSFVAYCRESALGTISPRTICRYVSTATDRMLAAP